MNAGDWENVEDYLESVVPNAADAHATKEGAVQNAVSVFRSPERVMLDRETILQFRDIATRPAS